MHDSVILHNSVVHTEFIVDFIYDSISEPDLFFYCLILKKIYSVDIMAYNN